MSYKIQITKEFNDVIKEMEAEDVGAFLKYLSACAFEDDALESGLEPDSWRLAWGIFLVAKESCIVEE